MIYILHRLGNRRARIARVVLAVFVMAWMNLALLAPVHAAMYQNADVPCHCKPGLCESLKLMQDQSDNGLMSLLPVKTEVPVVMLLLPATNSSVSVLQQWQRVHLAFRQNTSPPLAVSGILRI